jgi:hypothetical protein
MLAHALDKLAPDDVLLLDRGYPAAWLINLLNAARHPLHHALRHRGSGSWRALREFMRSDQAEALVKLTAPKASRMPPTGAVRARHPRCGWCATPPPARGCACC